MRWIIEDTEAHALEKRLAHQTGESPLPGPSNTPSGRNWRASIPHGAAARCGRALADEPDDIALRCADLPRRDGRRADEIVGYDDGLTA